MKLNKISKSFFINLDRRTDRLDHIYKNTPFFTERFPAIDSKSLELTEEIKKLFPNGLYLKKKKSEIACCLSHYKLWKQLVEDKDADNYLILEDDAVFEKGFVSFWNNVWSHSMPSDYSLIYLGGCQPYNKFLYNKVLKPHNNHFHNIKSNNFWPGRQDDHYWHMNASSYVISKQCASLMCQWVEQKGFNNVLDVFMIDFVNKNKLFSAPHKLFHLNPLMTRQLHEENDNIELDKNSDIRFDTDKFTEQTNFSSYTPIESDTDLAILHSSPGNKNVIYVVNGYDNYQMPDIWRYTKPTVISYAKKYNIDVIELRPKNLNKYVLRVFFKVDFLDTFINSHYEKAMLLDNDIAITNFTPDIFQQCNDNVLALDLSYSHPHIFEYCNTTFHNRFYPDKQKPQFSINSGLIVLNKQSAIKMEQVNQNLKSPEELSGIKTFKRDTSFMWEQCYFNYLINESKVTFTPLSDYQHWLAPYFSSIPISKWKFELSERPLNFIHMLESVGKTVGYRLMYECPEFFDNAPQPPFTELTKTQWCDFDDVTSKQNEFIQLKNEWKKLKNYDFLDFVAKNLPKRDIPKEKYTCYNPGQKIGIVSLYTPEISEYAIESEISIRDYVFKQGYTFHVYRDKLDKESHPNWSKPQALLNHFDDHDVIIWMDSDTIIFDTNQKFENILSECVPIKKIIACEDIGASLLNTGVLIFRSHKYTKNLIKKWLNFKGDKSELYSSGGDQEVFCDILKRSDNFGNNRKIFPMSKFNTDPRFVKNDTFIMHLMAYGNALKSVFMRYWGSK